jgi:regulator of protease activity HflC (stomatin/prohibitin superfamily)
MTNAYRSSLVLAGLGAPPTGRRVFRGRAITVSEWERAVLFRHGRVEQVLTAGRHRRWGGGYTVRPIDMRPWVLLVPTQEVPTSDGASVKITLAGRVRVADPQVYLTAVRDAEQALYLALQVALREVLGSTSVEDLLTNRNGIAGQLASSVRGIAPLGLEIELLEVKDIILPADLKRAHSEVLVARAQGLAALERARGETAALRSLANAARLASDNPALLQLRLLQQLDNSSGHTVLIGTPPIGAPHSPQPQ